jgi:hypothetical protein
MVYYIYNKPFYMLITKEVEFRVAGNVSHYYKENNINVIVGAINKLPIELINPKSHLVVDAKCDVCGKEVKIQYRRYNQSVSRGGYYTCSTKCGIEKLKKNFSEKYGEENPFKSDNFKEKSKLTNIKKWGTPHFRQSDKWKKEHGIIEKEKRKETIFNDFLIKNPNVVGQDEDNFIVFCEIHGEVKIDKGIFSNRKIAKTELCSKCCPVSSNISGKEILLLKLIKSVYDGEVVTSYKVERKEIDIYLPELKIGFEFNGLRWHSELYREKTYHIDKTNLCNKNGIRLIHIFEDDFDYKLEIVKSIIFNIIGKSNKIYARKTQVKVITDKETVNAFLNENHLQGFVNSNINYGLYYENELVSMMTFMKKRKIFNGGNKEGHYELVRFCNKLNYSVIGGASKLLNKFITDYSPKNILSYCDISWANGNLYKKLGFNYVGLTKPNYYYIINGKRQSRIKYQKHKLVKNGFNANLTETQIMESRGYSRIFNCGNEIYEYSKNK